MEEGDQSVEIIEDEEPKREYNSQKPFREAVRDHNEKQEQNQLKDDTLEIVIHPHEMYRVVVAEGLKLYGHYSLPSNMPVMSAHMKYVPKNWLDKKLFLALPGDPSVTETKSLAPLFNFSVIGNANPSCSWNK